MMFSMGNCVKTNQKDVVNSQRQPRGAAVRDSSFTRQSRERERDESRELEARREKKKEETKRPAV